MDEIDRESTFIREISKTDCGIRLFGIATIALIPRVPVNELLSLGTYKLKSLLLNDCTLYMN